MPTNPHFKTRCILLCAAIALSSTAPLAAADELTPQQAVEKYAQSLELLKTYDVTLTVTRTHPMKSVVEKRDGVNYGHYEPYLDGEEPAAEKLKSRQVTKGNASFRTEEFDLKTDQPRRTLAVYGPRRLSIMPLQSGQLVGFIETRLDDLNLRLLQDGTHHYGNLYVNALNAVPWLDVLGVRKKLQRIDDPSSPELYVIESASEPETPVQPDLTVRIALDPENGYLPAWIEQYGPGFSRRYSRIEILERKQLPAGIAVPTKARITRYDPSARSKFVGQPVEVQDYEIDLEKSRWNCELDDSIFTIEFPPGVPVNDQIKAKERTLMNPQLPQPRYIPRKMDEKAK